MSGDEKVKEGKKTAIRYGEKICYVEVEVKVQGGRRGNEGE